MPRLQVFPVFEGWRGNIPVILRYIDDPIAIKVRWEAKSCVVTLPCTSATAVNNELARSSIFLPYCQAFAWIVKCGIINFSITCQNGARLQWLGIFSIEQPFIHF